MTKKALPNQERLKEMFDYNPDTGVLSRRIGRGPILAGAVVGYLTPSGYLRVNLDGNIRGVHRVIWCYMTGKWPAGIDHRDTVRNNNKWNNLREANQSQNGANGPRRSTNKSGFKGVFWDKKSRKFRAMIMVRYNLFYLGVYDDPRDASLAYMAAAKEHFGEFARIG